MVSRRDLFASGVAGMFASPVVGGAVLQDDERGRQAMDILNGIRPSVERIAGVVGSNSLAQGYVPRLRDAFTKYLKANNKFPEYCEIGMDVFYDVYDWHVKHTQPLRVSRVLEDRLSIGFMFTTLVLRYDLDPSHIGIPFNRS